MDGNANYDSAWVAVGDQANWERGLESGIWGIAPALEHHWKKVEPGDLVLFYAKNPIGKFFGAGMVRGKFRQTKPFWKEEIQEDRVIWPYRFEFDTVRLLPVEHWAIHGVPNSHFNLALLSGLNPVKEIAKAIRIVEMLRVVNPIQHDKRKPLMERIFEIGQIQRMVVEQAVAVGEYSLDVTWKRTVRSVPTFGFSINIDKKLEDSLQPLKHSYDLWNTRPFLITVPDRLYEVEKLTDGLYHEFSSALKVLTQDQVEELYKAKKKYFGLEQQYGLR